MVTLYRYNGKLLFKNGGFATHERCCCDDDCPCDGCSHCPNHCFTMTQLRLNWSNCNCGYVEFVYPGTECDEPDCPENQGCGVAPHNGRSCTWVNECEWILHGDWSCRQAADGSLAFENCGSVKVTMNSSTELEFEVVQGPGAGCAADCITEVAAPNGNVTFNLATVQPPMPAGFCGDSGTAVPFGPLAAANPNAGSSPNGCFSDGEAAWTAQLCCPTDSGDSSGSGGSGGSGGGGGSDPLGCCTNADYTTTPDQTQADCEAAGGYWQQGDCDEGYP